MPLVLFNIGWMKHYRGQTSSDRIFNGGRYVEENETGSEVRNFEPLDGQCYGYVYAEQSFGETRRPSSSPRPKFRALA